MKKIVLASNNKNKIKEFRKMISNYEVLTLNDIGYLEDIEENGKTFKDNALIKAKAIHEYLKSKDLDYIVVAEDSGLCCTSLNGEPGVYSARYAGNHDNQANRDKLRKNLKGKNRESYYLCCIVLYYPDGVVKDFEGKTYGEIIDEETGSTEFGYDSIFLSLYLGKTFGEATEDEKNSVSHRGRAISKLVDELK